MLGVADLVKKKPVAHVKVQESSAVHDVGLLEGFEWIVDQVLLMS